MARFSFLTNHSMVALRPSSIENCGWSDHWVAMSRQSQSCHHDTRERQTVTGRRARLLGRFLLIGFFSNLVGEEGPRVRGVKGSSDCFQTLSLPFWVIPWYLLLLAESRLVIDSQAPRSEGHSTGLLEMLSAFVRPLLGDLPSYGRCSQYNLWRTIELRYFNVFHSTPCLSSSRVGATLGPFCHILWHSPSLGSLNSFGDDPHILTKKINSRKR